MLARDLLAALRPRQWLKNTFVLAPAVFAGHAFDPLLGRALWAAGAFCLASSAGYLLNDVADREADRAHPIKRNRPVARGAVAPAAAIALAVVLGLLALASVLPLGPGVALSLAAYLALTAAYSLGLKRVAVLEALLLASGFVVRLVAGALALPTAVSHWLVLCGLLLALLLAFGKREAIAEHGRAPLYPPEFLAQATTLLAGVAVVAYTLYTVAPETVAKVGSRAQLLTVPLVLYGVLRYLLLRHRGGAQDPTQTLLEDRPLLLTVAAWALLAGTIVALRPRP